MRSLDLRGDAETVAGVWLAMAKTALCRSDDAVDCGGGLAVALINLFH